MEYEQIKRLMDDMGNSKLTSIDIEFPDGIKIKMEKKNEVREVVVTKNEAKSTLCDEDIQNQDEIGQKEEKLQGNIVTSPMVGTFYTKSSPNANPYVEVGSNVSKGTILCIIEAMKLMNEIESEYEGKVAEIYVKDGEVVDYGKPLFRIV